MSPGMTLFSVQAVLILGNEDGARILAKYYSSPHGGAAGAGAGAGAGKTQPPPSYPTSPPSDMIGNLDM